MKFEHLIAFSRVAQHLSFSKAADSLYISQSALSRKISELEKAVGCPLFSRSTRFVQLTQAGHVFEVRAQRILREWEALCDEMAYFQDRQSHRHIHIGYVASSALPFITRTLSSPDWPEDTSEISLHKAHSADSLRMLREGRLDCILMHRPSISDAEGLRLIPIVPATVCAWVHKTHPLASAEYISVRQLIGQVDVRCYYNRDPEFYAGFDRGFINMNLPPIRCIETGEIEEIPILARQPGRICLAVSVYSPWKDFVAVPIEDWTIDFDLYLVSRQETQNPMVDHLADCIRKAIMSGD